MSNENKITVLGKTFNSEEERRAYFREELRKKLPELKKMEGFPIGEDEDILNLSDPPYYTACPNPWLNDFIAEWEAEKKELEKQGLRKADFEVTEPYAADVSEGKNNPVYKAHSYVTKVPHPAIMRYILYYTQPGDIVFDGFAGTGMTGVASSFCGKPDSLTKIIFQKEQNRELKWGSRNSLQIDLSTLATFIAYQFNNDSFKLDDFTSTVQRIIKDLTAKHKHLFTIEHDKSGSTGYIDYVIWSDVFLCKDCNQEIIFWDGCVNHEMGKVEDDVSCGNCGAKNSKTKLERKWLTFFDKVNEKSRKVAKRIPVLAKYSYKGKTYLKRPTITDIEKWENNSFDYKSVPSDQMPIGYNTKQPLKSHGYEFVYDFYSFRNLAILSDLNNSLNQSEKILLTSLLNRTTNLNATVMSNYFKQAAGNTVGGWAGKPREGTLYMPSISTEVNVLHSLKSRLSSISRLKQYIPGNNNNSLISTESSTTTSINSDSVDYIFTDPPFGANRMYSELNFISESWLKVRTNNSKEAIENTVHQKTTLDYLFLMKCCFSEFYRILKPNKWMTVEFSNTSAVIWNGIQSTIQSSGFIISNVSALDKKQGSVKAVTTPTAVKQDLIISCYKPSIEFDQKFNQHKHSDMGVWEFVAEHLEHLPIHLVSGNSTTAIIERSPKILFDRLIAFYVQRGLPVPIDAGKFQHGLRERFIERDGMFFTNEQVQVYDRKKAEVPNFTQLSIFVANEQDAIYWLRNILEKEPKTEQDLHPLWMKEVAGNMRKGDTLPEMRTILEENFLKNDKGQWYLPDPENEADLEKLRTKRLLKHFETYKTEAYKPKGKIKEARVEALRAGFKQCYQDKDFKTIVQIGERIPNNLLMEDEVLLQFYDIASSRV